MSSEFSSEFEEILAVRPGITGAASVQFRNESDLLATSDDPLRAYVEEVLPKKLTIEREYLASRSLRGDLKILGDTVSRGIPQLETSRASVRRS